MKFVSGKIRQFITDYVFYNYTFLLVYVSFATYFIKNNPELAKYVISGAGVVFLVVSLLIQVCSNYILKRNDSRSARFFYFILIFCTFTFLNLTYLLNYFEELNVASHGILRVRYMIIVVFGVLVAIAFFGANKFSLATRVLNTFFITFCITSIIYTRFSVAFAFDDKPQAIEKAYKLNPEKQILKKEKILLIVLDEYAAEEQVAKYQKDESNSTSFTDRLKSRGFLIIKKNPTKDILTENSMNQLFNWHSGLTFKNKSIEQVTLELKKASVVKILEREGYEFKNFSCFNIADHSEYYYISPFPRNDYEILLKNSMYFLFISNLTVKNLTNFGGFYIYADYNKSVYEASLSYLNQQKLDNKVLVYVHFMMPHPPLYSEKEFADRPVTFENYIAYWNYCNNKIIKYLNSIENIDSYKIIVTGDHGYRRDKRLDPNITQSAFYNFDSTAVSRISSVQDIGKLILGE